jgi:hypothetical protein
MWSMLMNQTDGFFVYGAVALDEDPAPYPRLGVSFKLENGYPMVKDALGVRGPFPGYLQYPITGLDGSFKIKYSWPLRWPLRWFQHEQVIHIVATGIDAGLKWRTAPASEPVIPDGSSKEWAVEIKQTGPDPTITMESQGRRYPNLTAPKPK